MKIKRRASAAKNQDFLVTAARSIGSTLGAIAAKVSPSPSKSHRRPAGRKRGAKQNLASKGHRRTLPRGSKRNPQAAGFKPKNRKKSAK
jgi:hypothetical protein